MKKLILLASLLATFQAHAAYIGSLQGVKPEAASATGVYPMVMGGKDGSGNIKTPAVNADGSLLIPTGASTEATLSALNGKVTAVNTGAVVVSSSALPSGASTSALQTTGNASLNSIDAKMPATVNGAQPVQINSTNFIASALNSTSTQLAPGATFTGTVETIFNQQSVSVLLTSDKAGTLTLNQYINAGGTKLISSWDYPITAGVPFSRAFTGNGNYFNLTFKNTDSAITTTLQIDTAYGTLPATTNLGNGNVSINEINGDAISNAIPAQSSQAVVTRAAPQKLFRTTFANAVSGGVDSAFWNVPLIGTGMTVNQTAGSLVITSGTTVNDETIIRSNQSFKGNMELKWSTVLSQRIVNNNFYVELVDIIGDGLAYTINSATSVTVTIPNNTFTSANVGQSLIMQQIAGTAGTIPGRYVISSVSGNNVTFTVAGFPASGTGTMSLVGWNYVRATYSGATATNVIIETQRRGYNTSSSFTATINTTAAPGHIGVVAVEDAQVSLLDQLQVAAASLNLNRRGESVQNLPEESTPLFLQIHALNGTVAPASTTTWTLGMSSLAQRAVTNVALNSITPMSQNAQLPVNVINTPAVTVSSGTVTVGSITAGANVIGNVGVGVVQAVDQASAAIVTTTTSGAKTITNGASVSLTVNATVVSGTAPTYDFKVQESNDGTIWTDIWAAQRLTAVSSFTTPALRIRGTQYRYVETISGTTPSFTRTITSARIPHGGELIRNIVDRTIAPTTTNSVTPTLYAEGASQITMTVAQGAGGIPVAFAIDGSMDGTNWVQGLKTVTGIVSGFSQGNVSASYKFFRARVITGTATTTMNYLQLEAKESVLDTSVNQNGSSSGTVVLNSVQTQVTPPVGAIGFILQNDPVSTVNIRFRTSGTATTTSGFALAPGQDSGFIPGAPILSLIAVSGTTSASYNLEWILK